MNTTQLQVEIDESMQRYDCGRVSRIQLGYGSEVSNLSANVSILVSFTDTAECRSFDFVSKEFTDKFHSGFWDKGHPNPDVADIHTTGGPLLIVKKISGDSVVRGVLRYLELEAR